MRISDWSSDVCSSDLSESLIRLTTSIFGKPPQQPFFNWQSGKPFELGTFKITPFLTDHSAFDAHMLLIEVAGKRIMYSGAFRLHGRKSELAKRLMEHLPTKIDALIMEGKNQGRDKDR